MERQKCSRSVRASSQEIRQNLLLGFVRKLHPRAVRHGFGALLVLRAHTNTETGNQMAIMLPSTGFPACRSPRLGRDSMVRGAVSPGIGGQGLRASQRRRQASKAITCALRETLLDLPVRDLWRDNGGAWNVLGSIDFKRATVVQRDGQDTLRVVYMQGSGAPDGTDDGGISFKAAPTGLFPTDSAMLGFDVFFEPGWKWARGGKFGGFHLGKGHASGRQHSTTASSHRIMWQMKGGAISYIYAPLGVDQLDDTLEPRINYAGSGYHHDAFAKVFEVGRWHSVRVGVRNNTYDDNGNAKPDGVAYLRVDGTKEVKRQIKWTASNRDPKPHINHITWNTFFGGPEAAPVDCVAFYRNFKLLKY